MRNFAYYGGITAIVFGIWVWATSGYDGCNFMVGGCGILNVLKLSAITGMGRNFLAFAIIIAGWNSMKWGAKNSEKLEGQKDVSSDKSSLLSFLICISGITSLTACAGAPVGWGGTHEITLANERAISIVYDPIVGGYAAANRAATEHCQKYGHSPVPTDRKPNGVLTEQVFECR